MPPPPPPPHVYPCLDWVPRGVSKPRPEKLRLTNEELRAVIASAKERALEARKRLGQVVQAERLACNQSNSSNNNNNQEVEMKEVSDGPAGQTSSTNNPDDDAIMREYGLDNYDDEDDVGVGHQRETDGDVSEGDADENATVTRGVTRGLASEMAGLVYHASNSEDPYLREGGADNLEDDDEDEENLLIKPTDNLIVAGHVHKDESSIEVYVYDNDTESFYLHHDIIQADYPCCVKWVGNYRGQTKNIAAAGYMNPEILLWDLDVIDVLEPIETLCGHTDAVIDISWNHHVKDIIASGSADKHVRLWNLDECKSISDIKLSGKVSALEFGLYEHFLLLAGDLNKNVSVIDTRTSSVIGKWKLTGEVEKVRWIPTDHSKFLVSDDQGYVYCFDVRKVKTDKPEVKFHAHEISVTGLEFSPESENMLVTASADDTVKIWDTKSMFRSGVEPTLIKEITDLGVGNILSLRMCPNSRAKIVVGGSKMAVIRENEIFNSMNK
jgi:periodic tryptophan protein 1